MTGVAPMTPSGLLVETYSPFLILSIPFHCVKTTLSTKPEVHNVLHCRQRKTEIRPLVTSTENLVKCGRIVFEICDRTDTDTLIISSHFKRG